MNDFFDCHTHEIYDGRSGFLIAIDGVRGTAGGYDNSAVVCRALESGMIPVQYITVNMTENVDTEVIKFHPRREKYSMIEIARYIDKNDPKAVIIDTLNEPYIVPNDYWRLLMQFPEIQFLLSHAGGFDILQFVEIAMFQKNAWIDFSYTQHAFGWCGKCVALPLVRDAIDYALRNERVYKKILFGSDNIRGERDVALEALECYTKYDSYEQVVKNNYKNFLAVSGI